MLEEYIIIMYVDNERERERERDREVDRRTCG